MAATHLWWSVWLLFCFAVGFLIGRHESKGTNPNKGDRANGGKQ